MKIVINNQYGGFNLSILATKEYLKLKGKKGYFYETNFENGKLSYKKIKNNNKELFVFCFLKDLGDEINDKDLKDDVWDKYSFNSKDIKRTDKDLIKVIEKLGEKANTICSTLKIIEIPDDVDWEIEEYDGNEWVAEKHRTWS